jgi:hypothetical protein
MKTVEDYETAYLCEKNKNNCDCIKCHTNFVFKPDECWFDEKGYGYSTKLCKCKNCGCINVVKHIEDYGFSKMNYDRRLYFKNK